MTESISKIILKCLLFDKEFVKKAFPYIKEDYFTGADKEIYKIVSGYISEFNDSPTSDVLVVALDKSSIHENIYNECCDTLQEIFESKDDMPKLDWAIKEAELFCQNRALYNASMQLISVVDGENKEIRPDALPDLMKKAVSVSFDSTIGHDYFDSAEHQYEYYHDVESRFPSKIELLNKITNGGIPSKTLNIFLAGINVGKTIWLVDTAADYLARGKNVLFISLEMPEEQIRQRVDANLFDIDMNQICNLTKEQYMNRVNGIRAKTSGHLVVKEYPSGSGHVGHFRHLINELKLKKGFVPDLLCVDYLGIMASSKLSLGKVGNTNTFFTEIAKELHGLAKEFDMTVWTAHQYTRDAQNASDVDMSDTSAAIGIAATADFILAGMSNDELEAEGKLLLKQLKNRYGRRDVYKKFMVGIDRPKMTYYNLEDSEQNRVADSGIPEKETTKPERQVGWNFDE